ncbi:MAG: squalene/phytoene synthase family protein [Anaerolineales bacterium]|nr:squalene/phytoene synthase family protein [Anaerolineales bacterium]
MAFNLTEMQQIYLRDKMNKVSRSFSLIVPAVEPPLNDYLAIAYLICRVVDNIEDCKQPFPWQYERFAEFTSLIQNPTTAKHTLSLWERKSWPGLSADEQQMMSVIGGFMLWQIFAQIPYEIRSTIKNWALVMTRGMEQVCNPNQDAGIFSSHDGIRLPAHEKGYDKYCYYVAGTVGRMITEMSISHYAIESKSAQRLLENSEASGRALQKTNIVKDFAKDIARGVCYLPKDWLKEANFDPLRLEGAPFLWKKKVLDNVLKEFDDFVNYILDLPATALGLRKACLMMLLPGYQTLLLAAKNYQHLFTSTHKIKISRVTMAKCLLNARQMAANNADILDYSHTIRAEFITTLDSDKMRGALP